MNTWTIGKRITAGFVAVLAILTLIGGYAVMQMNSAATGAGYLSNDYIPELDIAGKLQSAMADVRVNGRSYQFTGDPQYLKQGRAALAEVDAQIKAAEALAAKTTRLALLKEQVKNAPTLAANYRALLDETEKVDELKEKASAEATRVANGATAAIEDLIKSQTEKMHKDIASGAPQTALDERVSKITNLNSAIDLLNAMRIANLRTQSTRDPKHAEEGLAKFQAWNGLVASMLPLFRSPEDSARIKETTAQFKAYEDAVRAFNAAQAQSDAVSAKRGAAATELGKFAFELSEAAQSGANKIATEAASTLTLASSLMIAGVIAAILISSATAFLIISSTNKVLNTLAGLLGSSSEQVAAASGQVASASTTLAEGASEQAASLEETSASLEEIASMTKRNAENAQSAKDLAGQTRHAADTGATDMGEMSEAMAAIKSSSDNIAKIIKTIDEIAFQTNILALNAAVEAARAGDAGMGFAVVADEVRNLAQRSAQAAKETAEKIEDSITKSQNGVMISSKVQERLSEIVEKARQVDELVAEIATASREQSQGIDQVNVAVTQMDKVTQSNAASAEESASASEELSAQAETLREAVADLQMLVTGNQTSLAKVGRQPAESKHDVPLRLTRPSGSHGSNGHSSKHAAPKLALNSSRKDSIPMDDSFKEF